MYRLVRVCMMLAIWVNTLSILAQEQTFIPQPESVKFTTGDFVFSKRTKVVVPKKFQGMLLPYLKEKFRTDLEWEPNFASRSNSLTDNFIKFKYDPRADLKGEGYELHITEEYITITAKDYAGFFNGFQTLRQTFPIVTSDTVKLPTLEIIDNPRFSYRGVLLDVARHFQSKEFIMKQIDILSSYKINKFHWHLTDDQGWRIEIKRYPNLTEKGAWRADRSGVPWWSRKQATAEEPKTVGGFYTQEDVKEVIAYAKLRNVEIIPEIDVPGHSKALVASYPELFCSDIDTTDVSFEVAVGGKAPNNTICPASEFTYEFLEGVIEEIAALFPSKYIHIGGDECNKADWKKSAMCKQLMEEEGLKDYEELQSYFIQRMHQIVKKQKKIMIGWDEVLSGNGVPGATIMAWRRGKYTPEVTAPQQGYPTIMTSYKYMYISQVQGPSITEPEGPKVVLPLSKVYSHEPVPEVLADAQKKLVLGNQASLWGEFTPTQQHCEYMLYPRTLASAEVSWSRPETKNWQRFQQALEKYHFSRLQKQEVNVSKSLYSIYPSYAIDQLHGEAIVFLQTEAVGYTIKYTLDGSEPTAESTLYKQEFRTAPKSLLKAALFNDKGTRKGNILELRLK